MPSRPILEKQKVHFFKKQIPEELKMGGSSMATAQFNEINLGVGPKVNEHDYQSI